MFSQAFVEERKQESSMFLCPRRFETSNSQTSCLPGSQRQRGEEPGQGSVCVFVGGGAGLGGKGAERSVFFFLTLQFVAATSLCKHSVAHLNPILEQNNFSFKVFELL